MSTNDFVQRRHKTGIARTDDVIDKIIKLTVQTCLFTSLIASIDLILFLADHTALYLAFTGPLSKLYTNSLLSTLNARTSWAFGSDKDPMISISESQGTPQRPHVVVLGVPTQSEAGSNIDIVSADQGRITMESHEMDDSSTKRAPSN